VVGLDVCGYKNQNKFKEQTMIPFAALLSIGEKVLDKVIPDPEAKAKAQATLMEMAQRGELAQLEAQVQEMQSARDREVQIATSEFAPMLSKIVTPILALGTVGLTFILFGVIIFVDVDADSKDISDLCTRCADLCGDHGAWLLFWIVCWL
jgi:phage terminase Nu1 subunit (DNA packaging protein)